MVPHMTSHAVIAGSTGLYKHIVSQVPTGAQRRSPVSGTRRTESCWRPGPGRTCSCGPTPPGSGTDYGWEGTNDYIQTQRYRKLVRTVPPCDTPSAAEPAPCTAQSTDPSRSINRIITSLYIARVIETRFVLPVRTPRGTVPASGAPPQDSTARPQ